MYGNMRIISTIETTEVDLSTVFGISLIGILQLQKYNYLRFLLAEIIDHPPAGIGIGAATTGGAVTTGGMGVGAGIGDGTGQAGGRGNGIQVPVGAGAVGQVE